MERGRLVGLVSTLEKQLTDQTRELEEVSRVTGGQWGHCTVIGALKVNGVTEGHWGHWRSVGSLEVNGCHWGRSRSVGSLDVNWVTAMSLGALDVTGVTGGQ